MPDTKPFSKAVQDVKTGSIDPDSAASTIASASTSLQGDDLSLALEVTWGEIMRAASESRDSQTQLVDFLVALSKQPNDKDIEIHGLRLWRDLPMLGWEVNSAWNSLTIPKTQPERSTQTTSFLNTVHFVSLLIKTSQPVFQPFKLQILWTFRIGLESSILEDPDVYIPAIAVVVDVIGGEISRAEDEDGRAARGGELWQGKEGFCGERWALWRRRLVEVGGMEEVDEVVRRVARETAGKM